MTEQKKDQGEAQSPDYGSGLQKAVVICFQTGHAVEAQLVDGSLKVKDNGKPACVRRVTRL